MCVTETIELDRRTSVVEHSGDFVTELRRYEMNIECWRKKIPKLRGKMISFTFCHTSKQQLKFPKGFHPREDSGILISK